MKRRIITSIIIFSVLAIAYLGVFFFIYDESKRTLIYSFPSIILGVVVFFLLGYLALFNNFSKENLKLRNEYNLEKDLSDSLCKNNEIVEKSLPIVVIVYSEDYIVTYANDYAKKIFQNQLLGKDISYISKELYGFLLSKKNTDEIDVYGRKFKCTSNVLTRAVYLFDITESSYATQKFIESRPAIAILSLENLENSLENAGLEKKTELLGKYYGAMEKWRDKYGVFAFSTSSEKQMYLIKNNSLDQIKADQFSIIQDIDAISKEQEAEVSLSIGVGVGSEDYATLGRYAQIALDFANDRGGDQAVIYDGVSREAYGAKSQATERKSKVSAQIYSNKIIEMMKNASSIIVLPHVNTDADALGAALGVVEIAQAAGTPAKVLLDLDEVDSTVDKIISNSNFEYIKLRQSLIEEEDVDDFFTGKTLLIIVDHHEVALSPSKEIYKKASNILIIDHHRLTDKLEINASLQYIDHNASSSVEMITELISLSSLDIKISPYIATVMLVGLLIDTSNFIYHTGERTFETAATLMENGADSYKAKMYLREPISEQISRAKLLEKTEIVDKRFAIIVDESPKITRESLAKTADALLNIDNILAGFAIGRLDSKTVGISGRSNGTFNIHAQMEFFGGGGHFNIGAAQITDKSVNDVYNQLVSNLDNTVKGDGNNMKVILIEDVNKLGHKGDVVDVTPGYGNFLLSKKQAVEANASNIAVLKEEKEAQERQLEEELKVAEKTKELLEKMVVEVKVKTGQSGKLFGAISSKQISDNLLSQYNINVDKRKIILPNEKIATLGIYDITAKLHRDVTAVFKIKVVEDKEV